MPEDLEIVLRIALSLLAFGVIGWNVLAKRRGNESRGAFFCLIILAVLSVGMYFNFGNFHGRSFIHHWEFFHYFLNSKYFPELSYDGLYAASIKAQSETHRFLPMQPTTRDLRTVRAVPVRSLEQYREEVKARFSPDRWEEFSRDNRFFIVSNTFDYLWRMRSDHGCNASPTWIFVARIFDKHLPASLRNLEALACLDILLLIVMFVVVFRTYGAEIGLISLIIFCLNYPGRSSWISGAFLRSDWLAAAVVGVCMLKKEYYVTAGILFAYATMVRLFPAILLLGPAVLALKGIIREHHIPRWALRLGFAWALGAAIFFAAGCFTGRGLNAWTEFAGKIKQHHETWLTNNVGLQNVLLYGPDTFFRRIVDFKLPEPWIHWQAKMNKMKRDYRVLLWFAMLLYVSVVIAAAWRHPPDEAAVLGIAAIYATVLLTCYYWVMLLVLPFKRRGDYAVLAFFIFNVLTLIMHFVHPASEWRYGLVSWTLGLLFLIWTLPDALRSLRHVPGHDAEQSAGAA